MIEITNVRLAISQPLLRKAPSEWDCKPDALDQFVRNVRPRADKAFAMLRGEAPIECTPGDVQCQWCRAKLSCTAYAEMVASTVMAGAEDGFEVLTEGTPAQAKERLAAIDVTPEVLAAYLGKVSMIKKWCDEVEATALAKALSGELNEEHGWKPVEGRAGARAWDDPAEVEEMLKGMKIPKDQMYDFKLISPTTAEKVFADQPRRWKKIEERITRKPGSPTLAPASDKRPSLRQAPNSDGFDEANDLDDLL